ncbi:MAG: TlyA family RNA methyltransferase [Candidatus Odinarchaeota archaeon]
MKERIDHILVEKRLVESRTKAQWLIKNGYVLVENKIILKPSKRIERSLTVRLVKDFPYVSRGGLKLESALKEFSISVKGKICVDIGASVGGFTDCLIKHGALKVYSIDTATDLLHSSLKTEEMKKKILPILGLDARNLISVKEECDICTIDVTFASLREIIPNVKRILKKNGDIIALVKPIFETDFQFNKKFMIVKDPNHLFQILRDLIQWNIKNQIYPYKIIKSPILGKEGSLEFFIHLRFEELKKNLDYNKLIREILENN